MEVKSLIKRGRISLNPHDNREKIRYFDRVSNVTALILGKLLKENVEKEYWKKLGYESFSDFIAQENFSFSRRTAYNYMDLWDMYVKWRIKYEEFVSIPYSKLLAIKNVINEENLSDWLAKAKELSRTDLQLEVKEVEANKDQEVYKPFPKVYRCSDCGGWVVDIDPKDLCKCRG